MRITDFPLICEVKDEYIRLRQDGKNRNDACAELVQSNMDELTLGMEDDGLCFWIGLADGQYSRRELSQEVADRAIKALDQFPLAFEGVTPVDISRRRERYSRAPMPERKVGPPRKKFATQWKDGDVFAYQLSGEKAAALEADGKYILMQKITDSLYWDGRVFPVVTFSTLDSIPVPYTPEDHAKRQLLMICCGSLGVPYGRWQYCGQVVIKNEAQIQAVPLTYLGNFDLTPIPENEIRYSSVEMRHIFPERINDDLCACYRYHIHATTSNPETEPEKWPFWMTKHSPK